VGALAGLRVGSSPALHVRRHVCQRAGVSTQLSTLSGLSGSSPRQHIYRHEYGVCSVRGLKPCHGRRMGWVFGLIWWYVGPLTLLPLLLTGEIDWRISAASALLPSLLGHLTTALVRLACLCFEQAYTTNIGSIRE